MLVCDVYSTTVASWQLVRPLQMKDSIRGIELRRLGEDWLILQVFAEIYLLCWQGGHIHNELSS